MEEKETKVFPRTQHKKIYSENDLDRFIALDNPDDRITEQNGNGITLVKNDNPDDLEDKLVRK